MKWINNLRHRLWLYNNRRWNRAWNRRADRREAKS